MGLCKCPRKKVTNLFCFEHRVNVCEHCIIASHEKCIIQSYCKWLKDCDYKSICNLCNNDLSEADCVRLICYDVFHWKCLDKYARQFPKNTAPAGYVCPICNSKIFCETNLVSPVADALRECLSKANWARLGLGLPLLENHTEVAIENIGPTGNSDIRCVTINPIVDGDNAQSSDSQHSTLPSTYSNEACIATSSRKLFNKLKNTASHHLYLDHDEQKYKRRSTPAWLPQQWKNIGWKTFKFAKWPFAKRYIITILILFGFITLIMLLYSKESKNAGSFFDPYFNPHIKFGNS